MGIMKLTAGTLIVIGVLVSSAIFVNPFFTSANATASLVIPSSYLPP